MTLSEPLLQRSDLIGTQVSTRDTGKRLGVINQIFVDVDQRQVVALGMRNLLFAREQRFLDFSSVCQIGDVILVEDEEAIEELDALSYGTLINNEIITETGELLGRIRDFTFNPNDGRLLKLVIASFGSPWIPAQLISAYELPVDEIVSTGPERLIVFEGAQERLNQLTVGIQERLGVGALPWERVEDYLEVPSWDDDDIWDDENDQPPGSPIGRRPWNPKSPNPLETLDAQSDIAGLDSQIP